VWDLLAADRKAAATIEMHRFCVQFSPLFLADNVPYVVLAVALRATE
jgi:hypothetical protein